MGGLLAGQGDSESTICSAQWAAAQGEEGAFEGWSGPKHLVSAHTETTGQGPPDIQPGLPEVPMNLVFHSTNVAGAQSPLGLPRGAEELSWSLPSSAALEEGLLCSCCAAAALLMRKGIARPSKSCLSSLIPHRGHWSS